jgi:TonB-linked SusC/RagA family outer membrane protein
MKKAFIRVISVAAMLLLSLTAFAQKHQVSGKVIDASTGEPVIGAGVLISSGGGVVTDYDGNYTLEAADEDVLTFSSIGFESVTQKVDGRRVIDVSMQPDSQLLEEVVVLGYTTQKKAELSSAVVSIEGEKLRDVSTADVGNMLQGKVAGVVVMNGTGQPGANADIRIRGTGSITAGAGPLYVVDGVAGGAFNPNDIETITVLKDASATALYGAAASGGVIVVTTKSGGDNVQVNFKASAGIKKALTGRFHPMNSEELYDYKCMQFSVVAAQVLYPESLLEQDFDWMGNTFKLGNVQNYYLSVAGKSGKVNYYASLDHYNEKGTLINTGYLRTAARVNLSAPITDRLTMHVRLNYSKSNDRGESSWRLLDGAYFSMPWDIPYVMDADGNPTKEYVKIDTYTSPRPDNGKAWYTQNPSNILHSEQYNYSKGHGEDLTGDLQLVWRVTDWLTLTSTNRYDTSNSYYEYYVDPRTYDGGGVGSLVNSDGEWNGWGTTNIAKFYKTFGNHDVSAIAGWEYGEGYSRNLEVTGTKFPAGMRSLSSSIVSGADGSDYHSRTWALLGQAQYSYMGKYVLTASIRYDESYKFGPLNRGGVFPGVSGAWIVSKENFMANQDKFSFLKVRAGYGKTGNDNIPAFSYQSVYSLTSQYNGNKAAILERQDNPRLGWEEAYMASLGIDATTYNNINLTLDLYNTINTKILLESPRPPSSGFFAIMDNVGTVRNRGVEFAVDGPIIMRKNFSWTAGLNLGFNQNRVIALPEGQDVVMTKSEVSQMLREGSDIYSWYMPKWTGVVTVYDDEYGEYVGKPSWEKINKDGTVETVTEYSQATPQIVGSASPWFSGGLNTALRWNNFTLTANGNFVVGNKIYNKTRETMDSDGQLTNLNQMSHNNGLGWVRWDKDDESTWEIATHPKPKPGRSDGANKTSSRYLEDGSFFRLRNVTLSYDLPENIVSKTKMSGARVYLAADNILTLSRFSGTDPEVRLDSDTYSHAGLYSNNYPVPLSVVLGIDVKF